jgi:SAM-dependent methyltransferase
VKVLHVGCGQEPLPAWIPATEEVRADINPDVRPDLCASMTDLGDVGPFDCVYSSHSLEHLTLADVDKAMAEFHRVVRKGGTVIAVVPNIENVKPTEEPVYWCEVGPITGLDMIYGYQKYLPQNPYMAHKSGFMRDTFAAVFKRAGFNLFRVDVHSEWNLFGVAIK